MKHDTSTRSPGLRRYVAQPDRYAERYGNFTLTPRDYEILDLIYRYRYLEARHVRALVAGSDQQITRRLQGLFHNKYVGRYVPRQRMRLDLDPGPLVVAYGLERKGARALGPTPDFLPRESETSPAPVNWRKDHTRRTEWFLEHHLMVSNFHCVLELALCQTGRAELQSWSQTNDIWFQVTPPGARARIRVAPDAHFVLRSQNRIRHFFLEADRSTEEHRKIRRKIAGYWWYLQSGDFARRHPGIRRANVLFLTTGEERLRNLIQTVRDWEEPQRPKHAGRSIFWLATDQHFSVASPTPIFGPAWYTAKGGVRSLLP